MNFARTEDFFRMFHPRVKGSGNIVLQRKIGRSKVESQISTVDLEKVSRHACGLEDIYFSTAAFSGKTLLLNFSRSNCLHLQVPKTVWNTNILLTLRLEMHGVPLPTATTFDGETFTLLWILDTPIENNEFHIYTMLQQGLYETAKEFNPSISNLDIAFTTRMVGSINGNNKQHVGLVNDYGKTYSRRYLEDAILKSMTASEYRKMQVQAGTTLELMSLLGARWFSASQHPELFNDWIIFFGSSLCNFCTPDKLFNELCAIAESLEGQQWKKISEKYNELINSVISTAKDGYIKFDGVHLSINEENWRDLIKGKLCITSEEQKHLNLQVLGNQSTVSPHLHLTNKVYYPFGHTEFVPIERLLLKSA
jgi:hypothetical protein